MKTIAYHGTSADNLQSILENGLSCNEPKIWSASCDGVYMWEVDTLRKFNDYDEDYKHEEAFREAFMSAQCALAFAKDCRAVVVEFEIDTEEIHEDDSNPNGHNGAMVYYDNIPIEAIKSIKISNDLSLLKGYFIGMIMNSEMLMTGFTHLEQKIGDLFMKGGSIYPEDIDDIVSWQEVEIPELAQ